MRPSGKRCDYLGKLLIGCICIINFSAWKSVYATDPVDFDRQIRPILSEHCYPCHGPDKLAKRADLRLDRKDGAFRVRERIPVIVPSKPDESEMIRRVFSGETDEIMPPPKFKKRLSSSQMQRLRQWVVDGAEWEPHWSLVVPKRAPAPRVTYQDWARNPIDSFVLARLEREGLQPSPEADRATLIRRVSLDLTGLPPRPTEVEAFETDRGSEAYERLVDRLLASPHYGERQARPWLDQARYADTNGYEKDGGRSIWPYRDWVIRAFNQDMPFDQFTTLQLAGDLIANPTNEDRIATGFHRNSMINGEGGTEDEEFRVAAVVDRVNTTMQVWMGTTFACAQCHDHKYDPFSQQEYFQFFAFFNNTADGGSSAAPVLPLPTTEQTSKLNAIHAELAKLQSQLDETTKSKDTNRSKPLEAKIAELKKQADAIPSVTTMVMEELEKPRDTNVLIRGSHNVKGPLVKAGVPRSLHPFPSHQPINRLGLARWLADSQNPLMGRVVMNRMWAQSFGRGIVETGEDFGVQGESPSHPELLAWLAAEFYEQRLSLKAMQRLIVTSATYRQSSRVTPVRLEKDPYNRLFSRGPRFRMEAEMVRDQVLAISGLLKRKIGGPSVFPYQPEGVWSVPYSGDQWIESRDGDQYRRGLYTYWRRSAPYPSFITFDAPSREVCTERRSRTNTPLQALATLNDPAFVQPAVALGARIVNDCKGSVEERVRYGFRLVLARQPVSAEVAHLVELYTENFESYSRDHSAARAMVSWAPATHTASVRDHGQELAELAAWTIVANVLLNLDETLTKG